MHRKLFSGLFRLSFVLTALGVTQAPAQSPTYVNAPAPGRTFAYVVDSSMKTFSGGWSGSAPALRYAQNHPGSYVVFSNGGVLHRLDTPARLAELERTLAPMRELEARQKALAAEQKPLAAQQRDLGAQQRAASDPEEKGQLGAAQGAIGQEQGAIGAVQGTIGQKQGEIGRAFYAQVQTFLSACLADGSCPQVRSETAQR